MPTTCGHKDSKGTYCKWGESGAHYYYTPGDTASMKRAKSKADKQGRAIRARGWTGKGDTEEVIKKCIDCGVDETLSLDQLQEFERHSGIQSLRFDKDKFTSSESAVSWAKSHGFKSGDVEEMPNEWRLRQFDPKKCISSGGMKDLSPGVRGYICPTSEVSPGKSKEEILNQAEIELNNIKKSFEELKNSGVN